MTVEFTPLKIEGKGHRAVHIKVIDKPVPVTVPAEEVVKEEEDNDPMPIL
jgi:hypothetical protein